MAKGMEAVLERTNEAGKPKKKAVLAKKKAATLAKGAPKKKPGVAVMIAIGAPKKGAEESAMRDGFQDRPRGAVHPTLAKLEARIAALEAKLAEEDGMEEEDEGEEDEEDMAED